MNTLFQMSQSIAISHVPKHNSDGGLKIFENWYFPMPEEPPPPIENI